MTKQEKCKAVSLLAAMYYADTNNKFDTMVEIMTACGCDFGEIMNDLSDIVNRIYDINMRPRPNHGISNTDDCYPVQMSKDTYAAKS